MNKDDVKQPPQRWEAGWPACPEAIIALRTTEYGCTGTVIARVEIDATAADARLIAAAPDLLDACQAAQQCITDFLEAYGRGCALVVLDLAVNSLREDALAKLNAALGKAVGE